MRGLGEWPHLFNYAPNPSDDYVFRPDTRAVQTVAATHPRPSPALYEVFFVKRKICVVSGPGRRVGGPLEARSCPSKPWRRKMSLARRLSRPKPPEAVAEGQPLQGSGQRRRSATEVGGPRLRPSLA